MIQLPNGCSCSTPSISPKNYNKIGASIKKDWYVQYYFHDPLLKDQFPRGKFVIVKGGINQYHTLSERRSAAIAILESTVYNLTKLGFNPITGFASEEPEDNEYEIDPETPFIKALKKAYTRLSYVKNTMDNIRYVIDYAEKSAIQLRYDKLPIKEIRKKHIRLLIENVARVKEKWSAYQFNYYRSYLGMLFSELEELEVVEMNYCLLIKKQKPVKKIRKTLTKEERRKVSDHLKSNFYTFWRYMQIFFHSGARTTELLRLKASDVNLKKQEIKVLIKKGKQHTEVLKPIKNIALPFWAEVMANIRKDDYVFSENLKPGSTPINPKQISKRWRTHVKSPKTGLGIDVDFYPLKHLNTSEVIDALASSMNIVQAEEQAAKMNSHTSTQMVRTIYDVNNQSRKDKAFKSVCNDFA